MNIEDNQKLTKQADTRRAGTLESMPDDLFEKVKAAVDLYAREDDEY